MLAKFSLTFDALATAPATNVLGTVGTAAKDALESALNINAKEY